MKKLLIALVALSASPVLAQSSTYVQSHVRTNGTYVQGHYRTAPDSSRMNNWSTQGNTNPYTGRAGTVNPYAQPSYTNPYRRR